jgi:hypothetical protein
MRSALRRFDDGVLARLASDGRLLGVSDALAALPRPNRPWATALVIAQMLTRARAELVAAEPSPGRTLRRPPSELAFDPHAHVTDIAASLDALTSALRRTRDPLTAADLAVATHALELRGLGERMALGQLADAIDALDRTLPRRLRRLRPRSGSTPTRVDDESAYPIGGFSSMSTRGTMENLVTSELAIMEPDGSALREELGFDLFDLRWAQGELLSYVRDEAVATRERHAIVVRLDASLEDSRVKDPSAPWQRIVRTLAVVCVALRRWCELLGEGELHLHLVVPDALGPERDLLRITLRELLDRGVLAMHTKGEHELLAHEATWGDVVSVTFTSAEATSAEATSAERARPDATDALWVVAESPTLRWADRAAEGSTWEAATRALVEGAC